MSRCYIARQEERYKGNSGKGSDGQFLDARFPSINGPLELRETMKRPAKPIADIKDDIAEGDKEKGCPYGIG